jgi:hypothetical protein
MELAAKFNLAMGLRAKFNLVILAAFAVGFLLAAVALNRVFIDNAREQVLGNARIMMTAANAIRNYTVQELVPLLPAEHDGKFVPETVPAYAAQKNFKEVQAASPVTPIASQRSIRPILPIARRIGKPTSLACSATSQRGRNWSSCAIRRSARP